MGILKRIRMFMYAGSLVALFGFSMPAVYAADVTSEDEITVEEIEYEYAALDEEKLQNEEIMSALSEYLYVDEANQVHVDESYQEDTDFIYQEELKELDCFLSEVNTLVDNEEISIDEDGFYRITEVSDDYVIQEAVNDFSIRHTACRIRIFWKTFTIWVPVGYTIKLNTLSSLFFGGLSLLFKVKTVGAAQKAILANGSMARNILVSGAKMAGLATLESDMEKLIVDMLYAFALANASIDALTLACSGGLATILKKAITFMLATYIWTQLGTHFFMGSLENLLTDPYNIQQVLIILTNAVSSSVLVDIFVNGKTVQNIKQAFNNIRGGIYVNTNLLLYHQSHGKQ